MRVSRQEWATKLFSAAAHPIEFVPVSSAPVQGGGAHPMNPDDLGCSSLSSARAWLAYSANAAMTGSVRLAAPVAFSHFAVKGANKRGAALPEKFLAAGVGLVIGVGVSAGGGILNVLQAGGGVCMAGVCVAVANYHFAQASIASFEPQEVTP